MNLNIQNMAAATFIFTRASSSQCPFTSCNRITSYNVCYTKLLRALLAGLKGPALDWAYYRYCGHEAKLLPVLRYLQMSIDVYCGINRIKIKRETRAGIINVAIADYMLPVCTECDGAGLIKKHAYSAEVVCEKCHGAGRKRMSGRQMCIECGIDKKSWGNSHDSLLFEVTRLISSSYNFV